MIRAFAVAAVLAAAVAAPAAAVTYDAFTSFNGVQGNGGFTYGSYDGSQFTAYTGANGCGPLIPGTTCLSDGGLPGVFKSNSGAYTSGSVLVPGDALILHPGSSAGQSSAVFFTAPTAGIYSVFVSAFVADTNPSGVTVYGLVGGQSDTALVTLGSGNLSFSQNYPFFDLQAGDTVGIAINYDGAYFNDSTGLNFTLTGPGAVPEPASWALLIAGFGLTGAAMRRRRAVTVAA